MAIRVVLVDTDGRSCEKWCCELRRSGMDVNHARTGEEALRLLQLNDPDVMVLDAAMPWQGSSLLLERVKWVSPLVEVIVSVTHDRMDLAGEALQRGACDHIVKPMKISELAEKIGRAKERKTAQEVKIERATLERMVMLTERR